MDTQILSGFRFEMLWMEDWMIKLQYQFQVLDILIRPWCWRGKKKKLFQQFVMYFVSWCIFQYRCLEHILNMTLSFCAYKRFSLWVINLVLEGLWILCDYVKIFMFRTIKNGFKMYFEWHILLFLITFTLIFIKLA